MAQTPCPLYVLSDSQLLFWKDQGRLFLESLLAYLPSDRVRAAYVGAANNDSPAYYGIFTAAMEGIGIHDCRLIGSGFTLADQEFIYRADVILLAGGDVELGWRTINATGMGHAIGRRFREGAVLMGVSAGAVYLGRYGLVTRGDAVDELVDMFKFLPFVIGVHEERGDWDHLGNVVRLLDGDVVGIGIPSGGGLVYFPDGALQPIRHPISEFSMVAGKLQRSLLLPP